MKILLNGKIYDSDCTPIGIRLDRSSKKNMEQLLRMGRDTYIAAPKDYSTKQMAEMILQLKPECADLGNE